MSRSAVKEFATVALAGAVALSAFGANAQSVNFVPGKCYEGADAVALKNAIDADGQKPIFVGDRALTGGPVNKFTMNDNGYGYLTEKASETKLCLRATFKNVVLNYPDNSDIPSWAVGIKSNKGIDVQKMYAQKGSETTRLIFVAQTYTKDANGNEKMGKSIALNATPLKKEASVWSIDGQGVPDGLFDMANFALHTPNFNYFMGRGFGTPVASGPQNQNASNTTGVMTVAMKSPALQ